MKFEWEIIKEKIKNNVSDILTTGNPSFNNIDEAIDLFKKVILYKSNIHDLDGLPRILLPALQEAYITQKGEVGSLMQIAVSLEAYLKKIIVLAKNIRFENITGNSLISLFKTLDLNSELTNQVSNGYPQLEEQNINSFKGKDEYLEYLCHSRLIRNEVHNSPNWNEIEVFTHLRNVLIIYLYSTLKYKNQLTTLPLRELSISQFDKQIDTDENKMLYDFISFGNTTTEIKTQIVNAYILHFLSSNHNSTIDSIKDYSNTYFGKTLNLKFYERRINFLQQNNQVEYTNATKSNIDLTKSEKKRLKNIKENFADNKELFLLYYDDIITRYGLENESANLLEKLKNFFEANFNIDVIEAYDRGIEITENENVIYCNFIKYLKGITIDEEKAEKLFREILQLCNDSDFLIRLSASKVFSKLTNPDQFQNYIRLQERNVYLDTQIILHALCLNYCKNLKYDNIFYRVTDELIEFADENSNINLKVSKLYLSEVVYQLKLALLLIPFEDHVKSDFSNNIFYRFYNHLKINDLLEYDHNSFGDFLHDWLTLSEDDVYESDFEQIAKSNLQNLLKEELSIEVVYFPKYENKDSAINVLEKVIKDNLYNPKPYPVLVNDALMVCHLADNEYHKNEPFFLTWDKSFTEFRKEFKNRFNRLELISWHLFNPSKFLNHMALLDFEIDTESITNDYLSIIDSFGIHEKTHTIFDSINKFLDLKDISKVQRRKYVKIANDIFNDAEFSYDVTSQEDSIIHNMTTSFTDIVDKINSYYNSDNSKFTIHQYRKTMLDEDSFILIANTIVNEIKESFKSGKCSENYLKNIDTIIGDFEDHNKPYRIIHQIAANTGMPLAPPLELEVIKKI